jgi:D-aspartate ligase
MNEFLPPVAVFNNAYSSTLAFAASLGEQGIPLHVYGSAVCSAMRWSRYCTRFERCPPIDQPELFLPWLRHKIRGGEITRVAPTSDLIAFYLAELRAEFSVEVQNTIPGLDEIENCLIKTRFADVCASLGIATPESAAPLTLEQALAFAARVGYPLVMKAKSHLAVGMAERGAIIHSARQLQEKFHPFPLQAGHEAIAARYPELLLPLLQRFIPSATQCVYSVSGFKDIRLGVVAAAISYKSEQWPPRVGTSTHQIGCDDRRILRAGIAAVDQLLSCGIFELELLVDDSGLLAIDLNPRGFGFMKLDIARGSDLPWLWYQSSLGRLSQDIKPMPLPEAECRQPLPYYTSRLVGLLKGPRRVALLRKVWQELRTPWISMTGHWHDPLPKLLALLAMLRHPGSLVRPYWRAQNDLLVNAIELNKAREVSNQVAKPVLQQQFRHSAIANTSVAMLEHLATGAHPRLVTPARSNSPGNTDKNLSA